MSGLQKKDYVVLDFATADDLEFLDCASFSPHTARDNIIELAAVKVKDGAIVEHFSTFVAIEDFDPNDYEIGEFNPNARGLTSLHLIGAPKFKQVCGRMYYFAKDCDFAVGNLADSPHDPFTIFKRSAASCGYVFNQPVLSVSELLFASEIKKELEKNINPAQMTLSELAALVRRKKPWVDYLEDRDIYLFDKQTLERKGGTLTSALALAQLLTALIAEDEESADKYKPF